MKKFSIASALLAALIIINSCSNKDASYHFRMKDEAVVEQKVDSLLHQLTLKEKISMLGGTGFATKPVSRLGIPPLKMTDGPLGVRWEHATAFPSGTALAASWDTALLYEVGVAIGQEVRGKGRDVILGPNVNIARNPRNGRTFEGYGEDPYLTSRMAVNFIKGVQSQGVAATVKHFVANTQEYHRNYVSSKVSQRTLHEIYYPAFKAAVQDAHVLAIMPAYNKLNGVYSNQNHYLLTTVLRKNWGFKNLTLSDWGAVHATLASETSGLDLEMPTGKYLNVESIKPLVEAGKVSKEHINEQVRHILNVIISLGLMDNPHQKDSTLVNTPANRKLARKAARESIVLLENNHLLPLDLSDVDTITVMGPAAKQVMRGGGSSMVQPFFVVTPWEALKKRIGDKVVLNHVPGIVMGRNAPAASGRQLHVKSEGNKIGLEGKYYGNNNFEGTPVYTRVDTAVNFGLGGVTAGKPISSIVPDKVDDAFKKGYSIRWTGYISVQHTGDYVFNVTDNNGMRFFFNGEKVLEAKLGYGIAPHTYKVHLKAGKRYPIRLDYYSRGFGVNIKLGLHRANKHFIQKAQQAARSSDLVLAFMGRNRYQESEGHDLKSLRLPAGQGELLNAVTKVNPNTVVVLYTGTAVAMGPWHNRAGALLDAWFGGEEAGNAIVDVLMGEYNPAGKLPLTFPKQWSDSPASKTYRQKDSVDVHQEGIFVGYRYFDEYNIRPAYPFGYGLSYTTFSYSNLKVDRQDSVVNLAFTVKNTGDRTGHAVAQVYIHKNNSSVKRPPQELKGFGRIKLSAGQSKKVHIQIPLKRFAYYNIDQKKWMVEPGTYTIFVGSSSRDLPLKASISW